MKRVGLESAESNAIGLGSSHPKLDEVLEIMVRIFLTLNNEHPFSINLTERHMLFLADYSNAKS